MGTFEAHHHRLSPSLGIGVTEKEHTPNRLKGKLPQNPRDGRWIDGSRMEAPSRTPVARAAVAAIPCGVRRSQREHKRDAGRTRVLTIRAAGLQAVLTTPMEG
jgi:hypothetical protein